MPRAELDRQLNALRSAVLRMGEHVDASIPLAMDAFMGRDRGLADKVIAGDDIVDRECASIEERSAQVITMQQPALRDLRTVLAALFIAEQLERIGDHAEGIAQLGTRLPVTRGDVIARQALSSLAALAQVQLRDALDAYRACDAARAQRVWAGDEEVDALYQQVVQTLMVGMANTEGGATTDTYMLWVAHNLERIADRATNICERVVFVATGERRIRLDAQA